MTELSVLVVDDEPLARRRLTTILRQLPGVRLAGEAEDGDEAVALIRTLKPDVVLLDVKMPGLNGFDVLEAVQSLEPQFAVIACSGYFQEDARDLCQAIGFADILQKPYSIEVFCAIVRRCLVREPLAACTHA